VFDAGTIPDDHAVTAKQELLDAERHPALRAAFAHLPPSSQQLLALLTADPPMPYAQISATLRIPVGSIGPLRGRCLHQLRAHPALAALINADTTPATAPVRPTERAAMTISRRPGPADQNRAFCTECTRARQASRPRRVGNRNPRVGQPGLTACDRPRTS